MREGGGTCDFDSKIFLLSLTFPEREREAYPSGWEIEEEERGGGEEGGEGEGEGGRGERVDCP